MLSVWEVFIITLAHNKSECDKNMSKPIFDKDLLHTYFENKKIWCPKTGIQTDFSLDVIFDEDQVFWKQNGVKYEMADETNIINNFKEYFSNSSIFLNSGIKNKILEAYRQYGRLHSKEVIQIPEKCIVFNNSIIYVGDKDPKEVLPLRTIIDDETIDKGYIMSNFKYFITNPIGYDYKPSQEHKCPTIDRLFREWVIPRDRWNNPNKEDLDKVKWLYEIIAWCMIPNYDIQEAIILSGSGKNGKSKGYIALLEKIIGEDNCTATNITTLTETNFGVAQLYKKLVCTVGEVDGHKLERTSIIKSLTGGDKVPAQFKNKQNFTFRNYAKIILSTNIVPQTSDKTIGFYRRFLIIDFPNKFEGDRNILNDIPEEEFEALANICVGMLKGLVKRNKFTNEPTDDQKAIIYEQKSNPLQYFLSQNFELTGSPDDYIFCYDFVGQYNDWLKRNGYPADVSSRSVGIEMHEKGIQSEKRTDYNKIGTPQYYAYIGLKPKSRVAIKEEPEIITEDKEYTKQEIFDYFVNLGKIAKSYNIDEAIRILKTKSQEIYEPRNGVYKINKGNSYGQSLDN